MIYITDNEKSTIANGSRAFYFAHLDILEKT